MTSIGWLDTRKRSTDFVSEGVWVRKALRYDITAAVSFVSFSLQTLYAIDVYDFIT